MGDATNPLSVYPEVTPEACSALDDPESKEDLDRCNACTRATAGTYVLRNATTNELGAIDQALCDASDANTKKCCMHDLVTQYG